MRLKHTRDETFEHAWAKWIEQKRDTRQLRNVEQGGIDISELDPTSFERAGGQGLKIATCDLAEFLGKLDTNDLG